MPWSSINQVPKVLRTLDGVPLSLAQANLMHSLALEIGKEKDYDWQLDVFKAIHEIRANSWVTKEIVDDASFATVVRKEDGSYWITAVSTAALPDRDEETFTVKAIDYDIRQAESTGVFPEFRAFHNAHLGFGQVKKMRRVGIFAVDEGPSYTDPFSIAVCEKMLSNNTDGKWRVSRGFYALEIAGHCPKCDTGLVVRKQHLVAGFRCPTCESVYLTYKHTFKGVKFLKARTFDVTVTDIPCVPWTGISATQLNNMSEDISMTKSELKQRLLDAGLPEDAVDSRLKELTAAQLKQLDGIPDAEVLKEFIEEDAESAEEEALKEQVIVLDESVLKDIRKAVHDEVESTLDGLTLDLPESKEAEAVTELKETVKRIEEKLDQLLADDKEKVKKEVQDLPRGQKLRIRRFKAADKKAADEEDPEDQQDNGDDEEAEGETKKEAVVATADGEVYGSMSELIYGKHNTKQPRK